MQKVVRTYADFDSNDNLDGFTLVVFGENAGDEADPEADVSVYSNVTGAVALAADYGDTILPISADEMAPVLEMFSDAGKVSVEYGDQIRELAVARLAPLLEAAFEAQRAAKAADLLQQAAARQAQEEAIKAKYNLR